MAEVPGNHLVKNLKNQEKYLNLLRSLVRSLNLNERVQGKSQKINIIPRKNVKHTLKTMTCTLMPTQKIL